MSDSDYQLSDRLFALRRRLVEFDCGVTLSGEDVRKLASELKECGLQAQQEAHELRRLRAYSSSRLTDLVATRAAVISAASAPDSNVRMLSFERPFGDGAPS